MSVLLDTHALLWYIGQRPMANDALVSIARAQAENQLHVSLISAWEIGIATLKQTKERRPDLQDLAPDSWFRDAIRSLGAIAIPIQLEVALEAARVPLIYGSGDPGDCFLIATARVNNLALITRDKNIHQLARQRADYIRVIGC